MGEAAKKEGGKEEKKEGAEGGKKEGKSEEKKEKKGKGKAPRYYCSVSQKMWCKVESAESADKKWALKYDCKGKKRKVKIGGTDERVSFDETAPEKPCGKSEGGEEGAKMSAKGSNEEEDKA